MRLGNGQEEQFRPAELLALTDSPAQRRVGEEPTGEAGADGAGGGQGDSPVVALRGGGSEHEADRAVGVGHQGDVDSSRGAAR